jgi:hypothetical protein
MHVKQRQQLHMNVYVGTKAFTAATAEAEVQLEQLMGSVPLLNGAAAGSWEAELARLWLTAEGLRAEVEWLKQRKKEIQEDVTRCQQVRAAFATRCCAVL